MFLLLKDEIKNNEQPCVNAPGTPPPAYYFLYSTAPEKKTAETES